MKTTALAVHSARATAWAAVIPTATPRLAPSSSLARFVNASSSIHAASRPYERATSLSPVRIAHDLVRAFEAGTPVALRYPHAVRPWQHVLDPLAGYLMLAQAMITDSTEAPTALNFAPDADSFRSVCDLVQAFSSRWGG